MGVSERKLAEKTALRNKILAAATAMIEADGVLGFSMRKLAKEINYSPTTIYLFFKDKGELLRDLSELGSRRFTALLKASKGWRGLSPIQRLASLMRHFIEICLESPKAYLNSFFGEMPGSPPSLLWFDENRQANPSFALFQSIISEGIADGSMKVPDPEATIQACWAASHGLILSLLSMPVSEASRRQAHIETMIAMLVAGISR